MDTQVTTSPASVQKEKTLVVMQSEMKAVYNAFTNELMNVKKEYRENLNVILKNIDERKIKDLKEKLKNL